MGNTKSTYESDESDDIWWTNGTKTKEVQKHPESSVSVVDKPKQLLVECGVNTDELPQRIEKEGLNEFYVDLEKIRQRRTLIIAEKRKQLDDLRGEVSQLRKQNEVLSQGSNMNTDPNSELERLRTENEKLKEALEEMKEEVEAKRDLQQKNHEMRINIAELQSEIQNLNSDMLNFENERKEYEVHVTALKEVIKVSKQLLQTREEQMKALKLKIESIENSLASKELNLLSQNIKEEYEKQLDSIRNLRRLYEERQRAFMREKEELKIVLVATRDELEKERITTSEQISRIEKLEEENSKKYDEIKTLESNLGLARAEFRQSESELAVINQLFSQILTGFNNNQEVDLDKLRKILEENHDLLQNIVENELSTQVSSALPKVLLDLVNQINDQNSEQILSPQDDPPDPNRLETIIEETDSQTSTLHQLNSPAEIVENLPKVWRVLIELLSHQCPPVNTLTNNAENNENPCYKLVQTPKGPNFVLSVSQTFIRLKDLILEKKSLEKEVNHLKHLNTHLETRLQDQESRLVMVSGELSKTWTIVGKLQKQHQVLHTQEQILRYELAQKRKLLNSLKEELEDSREKWLEAREKNSNTEKQWKQLRKEFATRKLTDKRDFNSTESGYSDEREGTSSEDEPGYETDISECNPNASPLESNPEADLDSSREPDENCNTTFNGESNDNEAACGSIRKVSNASILDVIQDELREIEGLETIDNSSNDTYHSTMENEKTDEVQPVEKTTTNTVQNCTSQCGSNQNDKELVLENNTTKSQENQLSGETSSAEELRTAEAKAVVSGETPGPSVESKPPRTLEDILAAREERLRRMEGQCQQLVTKVTGTSQRSVAISNKLDNLHEVYGDNSSGTASDDTPGSSRTNEENQE